MRTRKTPPPTHTERERKRDVKKGRETNKVFVSDACDRIEDCRRERERKRERERERERTGVRERGRSRFMHQRLI